MDTTAPAPVLTDIDGIPIYTGPGLSECCWVESGQPHTLSCDTVTVEQAAAFIANR